MSILMFVPDSEDDYDKSICVPVLNEAAFRQTVLPVAERIGAEMVCRLGIGMEVDSSSAPQLQKELRDVIEKLPQIPGIEEYVEPRLYRVIDELKKVFEDKPNLVIYIG